MVTQSSMPALDEYVDEIKDIWDSHWLTNMGMKHKKLESMLKVYLDVPEISLFVNGHMALEMAIQALNLSGEVITTPFTFISTTHAIVRNGLTPVFCDINEEDYTININQIEQLITQKTSAIIPVHVYGNVCNVEKIEMIAKKYQLKVIYDAAHAFGVRYKGIGIGRFGDASMFSFHATKVYNTIEGGAVSFSDKSLENKLYNLKNFGTMDEEIINSIGANTKMNEFQAAMGICNLKHIGDNIQKRRKIVEYYKIRLGKIEGIILCKEQNDVESNFAYFPVLFQKDEFGVSRDAVYEELKKRGIYARKYFFPLTNRAQCYKGRFESSFLPVAEKVSNSVLTLPLYPELLEEDVDKICDIILGLKR